MRCPKCGYNSFDHLDSCRKCGKDLVEFKQRFGVKSVLFPGEMKPLSAVAEAEVESAIVDAAVAAATAGTAAAAVAVAAEGSDTAVDDLVEDLAADSADKADDFGFDFMGDSEEEDDLSFDELFEDAPADEDVEDTLEAPQAEDESPAEEAEGFDFDLPDEDSDDSSEVADLDEDFGFDPETEPLSGSPIAEEPETEEVEAQLDAGEDFTFAPETEEVGETATEPSDSEEDPKDPFELPESSALEGAPEPSKKEFIAGPALAQFEEELETLDADLDASSEGLEPALTEVLAKEEGGVADVSESPLMEAEAISVAAGTGLAGAALLSSTEDADESLAGPAAEIAYVAPPAANRVGAFFFDLLLLIAVGAGFVFAAEAAISASGDSFLPSLETLIDLSVPYFLVLFSVVFGYFTLFHFLVGQTPGKMLTGIRVESQAGEPLSFAQAFLRSVGGLIQLLPLGLGYLVVLLNPERRGWNDQLAGTRLVLLADTKNQE